MKQRKNGIIKQLSVKPDTALLFDGMLTLTIVTKIDRLSRLPCMCVCVEKIRAYNSERNVAEAQCLWSE